MYVWATAAASRWCNLLTTFSLFSPLWQISPETLKTIWQISHEQQKTWCHQFVSESGWSQSCCHMTEMKARCVHCGCCLELETLTCVSVTLIISGSFIFDLCERPVCRWMNYLQGAVLIFQALPLTLLVTLVYGWRHAVLFPTDGNSRGRYVFVCLTHYSCWSLVILCSIQNNESLCLHDALLFLNKVCCYCQESENSPGL